MKGETGVVDVGNKINIEMPLETMRATAEEIIAGDVASLAESRIVGNDDISAGCQSPRLQTEEMAFTDGVRTADVVDSHSDKNQQRTV